MNLINKVLLGDSKTWMFFPLSSFFSPCLHQINSTPLMEWHKLINNLKKQFTDHTGVPLMPCTPCIPGAPGGP